ncbi:Amino acid adenylation domain-containing protein (Fragment) OS=Streptomyces tendae OX=1932 GN=GUR47_38495 PE=4 SV=1 [Streptomyces tendae]
MTAVDPRPARIPLSYAQQRLWFLNRFEGPSATYNAPVALRLTGSLDREALRQALADVVDRHESLRTVFAEDAEGAHQVVRGPADARPEFTIVETDEAVCVTTWRVRPATPSTLRPKSRSVPHCALSEEQHVLLLLTHHIVSDAWSRTPLARDLTAAYAARVRNAAAPQWAPLPVQYADYSLWQRDILGTEDDPDSEISRQLDYWTHTLTGLPDRSNSPTTAPAPPSPPTAATASPSTSPQTCTGASVRWPGASASPFMVLQAGLAALLTRLGAGTDIPLGTPIAGRTDEALDDLIGVFLNTLVLRTDTSENPTFAELVDRVRERNLGAYAHQDLPFERLVEAVNPERSLARHPLFQVLLTLNNTDYQGALDSLGDLPGLGAEREPIESSAPSSTWPSATRSVATRTAG